MPQFIVDSLFQLLDLEDEYGKSQGRPSNYQDDNE